MSEKTVFSINLWDVYQKEGRECVERGDLDGARERFLSALEKAQGYGLNDPRVATSKRSLAEVYVLQGNTAAAEQLYQEAIAVLESALGNSSAALLKTLKSFSRFLEKAGRREALLKLTSRITEIESNANEPLLTSDVFEEPLPDNADTLPMTPDQRRRIAELIQREEIAAVVRDKITAKLRQSPSYLWAHKIQGKLRQEIVRSYQPEVLREESGQGAFEVD